MLAAGDFVCEPDEYALLVHQMRRANIIKDHSSFVRNYKKSFKGQEFVEWAMKTKNIGVRLVH